MLKLLIGFNNYDLASKTGFDLMHLSRFCFLVEPSCNEPGQNAENVKQRLRSLVRHISLSTDTSERLTRRTQQQNVGTEVIKLFNGQTLPTQFNVNVNQTFI